MNQTFKLKSGSILFQKDCIIINDNAKKQKLFSLMTMGSGVIYGFFSALNSLKAEKQIRFWFCVFIGVLAFVLFIFSLTLTVKSEIPLNEVRSIKVRKRFANIDLIIRMKGSKTRRVIGIENASELEKYIETNLDIK